ncbi:MAG: hypothetical protein COA71_13950 [SAR86 cluster bacterium]|uniref:Tat pathway signal protein n=1 Tax=SAR86 cluster bacterium TaxID=2030880 RepID=A0A2A5C7K9_9GAMM|nr:MAG: hypothetical protein COA71_13950 [SAR86 cluster bacterium]
MINRRRFIQSSSLATLPLWSGTKFAFGSQAEAAISEFPLYTVVYDEESPDSIAFANEAERMGQHTSAISNGDVTKLWYDDLYHHWKQAPVAIGGLTTLDAFFCLEIFGNDAGLRRVLKVEHRREEDAVKHQSFGMDIALDDHVLGQDAWSERMAQILINSSFPKTRTTEKFISMTHSENKGQGLDAHSTLVSWMIAPRQVAS